MKKLFIPFALTFACLWLLPSLATAQVVCCFPYGSDHVEIRLQSTNLSSNLYSTSKRYTLTASFGVFINGNCVSGFTQSKSRTYYRNCNSYNSTAHFSLNLEPSECDIPFTRSFPVQIEAKNCTPPPSTPPNPNPRTDYECDENGHCP